jgi:hypothetical protein
MVRNRYAPSEAPVRPPTMAELVVILRDVPDGPERAQLEDAYWAKATHRYGIPRARHYRWEYEWLRAHAKTAHARHSPGEPAA